MTAVEKIWWKKLLLLLLANLFLRFPNKNLTFLWYLDLSDCLCRRLTFLHKNCYMPCDYHWLSAIATKFWKTHCPPFQASTAVSSPCTSTLHSADSEEILLWQLGCWMEPEVVTSICSFLRTDVWYRHPYRLVAIHGVAKSRTRLSDWTEVNWMRQCPYYDSTNIIFIITLTIIFKINISRTYRGAIYRN